MGRRDFRWQSYLQERNIDSTEVSDYSLPCPQSPENVDIQEAITTLETVPISPVAR